VSASAPLHQAGSVEWVAAVFALARAREQLVLCKPLGDDLCVGPHVADDSNGHLGISGGRITAEMCGLPAFDEGHRLMTGRAVFEIIKAKGFETRKRGAPAFGGVIAHSGCRQNT
jgi:hypothetical protein